MSKRSIVALTVALTLVTVVAVGAFFHGHHLWQALLDLHSPRPH